MDTEKSKNIEKIKTLHDLKSNFKVDEDSLKSFKEQITDEKFLNDIERFFRGYEAEDIFKFIFSVLPWVKLVTPLDQEQLPIYSKENYQTPDFLVYIENDKRQDFPVLFEVKSINKDKMKLELMEKQVKNLINYSEVLNLPLLFAIYWRRFNAWIITSIEYFTKKNDLYVLDLEKSLKNDLSVVISDFFYIFNSISVKSTYKLENTKYKKIKYEISTNGSDFIELKPEESVVFDCFIDFEESPITEINNQFISIKKNRNTQITKISYIITRYLKMYGLKIDANFCLFVSHITHTLINKLKIRRLYIMPSLRSKTSDVIFEKAFESGDINKKYKTTPFLK